MKLIFTATAFLAVSQIASAVPVPEKARGILPTTPGLALTSSLINGFGLGPRNNIAEGKDQLDKRGFKGIKAGFKGIKAGFKEIAAEFKEMKAGLSEGFSLVGKILKSVFVDKAGLKEYHHANDPRGLPHAPDSEFCYYERPNNIFVKMPCNSDRPGLHCYLETGECEVVTRIGQGHGSPNSK